MEYESVRGWNLGQPPCIKLFWVPLPQGNSHSPTLPLSPYTLVTWHRGKHSLHLFKQNRDIDICMFCINWSTRKVFCSSSSSINFLDSIFKDHLNEFQAKINKPPPETTGCKLYNTVIQSVSTKLKCNSKVLASLHCRSEVLHNQVLNFSKNSFNEQMIDFWWSSCLQLRFI